MYSFTDSSPVYEENSECHYYAWITEASKTSCSFYPAAIGADPGQKVYFSITALYCNHSVRKAGNTISLTMPENSEPEDEYSSSHISGSISGTTVHLSWSEINDERFAGYKVVYSFSNSHPKYPDDRYKYYITNSKDTSCNLDITSLCCF